MNKEESHNGDRTSLPCSENSNYSTSSCSTDDESAASFAQGIGSDKNLESLNNSDCVPMLEDDYDLLILPPEDPMSIQADFQSSEDDTICQNAPSLMNALNAPIKSKKKKKKRRKAYSVNLANCKYDSVRRVSQRSGLKVFYESEECNIFWTDLSVTIERVCSLKRWQKVNHFPGMSEICRKDSLSRNLNRMAKLFPKTYNFFPKSWCLPADWSDLQNYAKVKKHKTYILKPDTGCQGKGIWMTKSPSHIKPTDRMVCQVYISRPFLLDGFKFDMRLYVLITSCDPLRIYMFKDGLARFATQRYKEPTSGNVGNVFIHLTNYALQKHSDDYIRDDEECGTKRRITTVNRWLIANGYDVDKIWADIDDAIIKTVLSGYAVLKHNYRTCFPTHLKTSACFEILGFDVILDKKLKPFILEVNHSPSFHTDARLDKEIKEALLWDTIKMINLPALDRKACIEEDRRKIRDRLFSKTNKSYRESRESWEKNYQDLAVDQLAYEMEHIGNFRRIYPPEKNPDYYAQFFSASVSLYSETASFKARTEFARQIRDEIRQKQEQATSWMKRPGALRPESPGGKRSSTHRLGKKKACCSGDNKLSSRSSPASRCGHPSAPSTRFLTCNLEAKNITRQPLPILEREENERIADLVQRESLLKRLGVIDMVYKLLSGTTGVTPFQHSTTNKQTSKDSKFLFAPNIDGSGDSALMNCSTLKNPNISSCAELKASSQHPMSAYADIKPTNRRDLIKRRIETSSGNKNKPSDATPYWINGNLRKPSVTRGWLQSTGSPMTMTNFITKPAILSRDTVDLSTAAKRANSEMARQIKSSVFPNNGAKAHKTTANSALSRLNDFILTENCLSQPPHDNESQVLPSISKFENCKTTSKSLQPTQLGLGSRTAMAKLTEFYAKNCQQKNLLQNQYFAEN